MSEVDTELNDETIDGLLNGDSTPSRDIPMREEAPAPTTWAEDKFTYGGKEVKGSREQILKWAEMGYGYPQKAQELNLQKANWEKQLNEYKAKETQWKDVEQKWAPYKEVDEFAAKNPQWWTEVQAAYKAKIAGAESNPEIAQLKSELAELKKFRDEYSNEKTSIKRQEEDTLLAQEVESIRKQYPNVDFDTPDEDGKSLEMKVLEHADKNNISTFRAAYRDFYHDQLVSKAREEGKELVAKDVQKRTKLGILSESSKPTKGLQVAKNVKDQSYESLLQEALEEVNAGRTA